MIYDEIDILKRMISIDSQNLPGDERAIVDYCHDLLSGTSAQISVIARHPRRPNVIASIGDASRGPTLILQSHLDTKPAAHSGSRLDQWDTDPLEPVLLEDRLYGLGSCDTKGGAAAYLAAFLEFAALPHMLNGCLLFQGVADEEHGSAFGAEVLLAEGLLVADYALVAEPTSSVPSLSQFGNCWVKADITGIAAHGGTPWMGCDAIVVALELAAAVQSMLEMSGVSLINGHPRLRIGGITGGGHAGTVASMCSMITDIRVLPGQSRDRYLKIWAQALGTILEKYPAANIELSPFAGGGCEPHVVHSDSTLGIAVARAWRDVSGLEQFNPATFFGGSDARYFEQAGTPAVVLGPGNLEQAHMPNEFVPIAEVRSVRRIVGEIIKQVLF